MMGNLKSKINNNNLYIINTNIILNNF
jgi:hypothetical protein